MSSEVSIKLPRDVWQLIIDKIDPDPIKLPQYILYYDRLLSTKRIISITKHDSKTYMIYYQGAQSGQNFYINESHNPKSFSILRKMFDHCELEK